MLDGTNNDETTMTTFHLFIDLHTGVFQISNQESNVILKKRLDNIRHLMAKKSLLLHKLIGTFYTAGQVSFYYNKALRLRDLAMVTNTLQAFV